MEHEHAFTDGWIRGGYIFRACVCGIYDNPNVLESDFDSYSVPDEGVTNNA